MNTAVRFQGVERRAAGAPILRGVSLDIPVGQRVALIGPSGAGKTTLLRLVAGFAHPSAGAVHTLGEQPAMLRGRGLRALRRRVGFLQQSGNLVPQLRVAHNVLIGRLGHWSLARALWSLLRPQEVGLAAAALRRVELAQRLWAMPDELSGGEQQRVAIARLLVQQPELWLLDEPLSALDIRLGRQVLGLLLGPEDGASDGVPRRSTVVVSLHDLALLDAGFDRVIALQHGRVVADDPPKAFDPKRLGQIYGPEPVAGRVAADGL